MNDPSSAASAAAPPSRSTVKAAAEEAGVDPALAEQARTDPALPSPPSLPADMSKRQQQALLQRWLGGVQSLVRSSLLERVQRDHRESNEAFLRRRIVAAITLVVGGTLLGISLAGVAPGDPLFYYLTFALALTWLIGSFSSGRLHLGRIAVGSRLERPILQPILVGLAAAAIFCAGAFVAREVPVLNGWAQDVLDHAKFGSLPLIAVITLVNGIAEEIFFRGALFAAIGVKHPVAISTVIYTLTTVATFNPMLVASAGLLGLVCGLQRRASGGVLAPILTHITWSQVLLFALPPIFAAAA